MFEALSTADVGPAAVGGPYPDAVTAAAHHIAAEVRRRLPGVPTKKLHKLLYYCQGHHLAAVGRPLFSDPVSAWDMGPVVGTLWRQEKYGEAHGGAVALGEAELNTIGYVVSRYGMLTGRDLEILTHGEPPWQRADRGRRPGESARIEAEWMRDWFASDAADDDADSPLDSGTVRAWLEGARERSATPARPDDLDQLRARLPRGA